MSCEYCGRMNGHEYRCPKYVPPKSNYICCYCKDGIYPDEEYISNIEGEYIHRDCIPGIDFLIDWLGYEIKYMKENEAYDY